MAAILQIYFEFLLLNQNASLEGSNGVTCIVPGGGRKKFPHASS